MNQPDNKPGPALQQGEKQPLPLFRPEALASQQQKLYGEILLIRPLSLAFLGWLGVAMAGSVLGFLLLGQITEKARVSGVLLPARETSALTEADLFVPDGILGFVQPGEHLLLVGPSDQRQSVTVQRISNAVVSPAEVPLREKLATATPMHRVVVTLSSPIRGASSATYSPLTRVEAEIPLGRKALIKWLFGRPGA